MAKRVDDRERSSRVVAAAIEQHASTRKRGDRPWNILASISARPNPMSS